MCLVAPNGCLMAKGKLALEVFSGESTLTLALELHTIPTMCPWDVVADSRMNVIDNGWILTRDTVYIP